MFMCLRLFVLLPLLVGSVLFSRLRASEDKSAASIAASMKNRLVSSAEALEREKELKTIFKARTSLSQDVQSIIFLYLKSSYYHARTIQSVGYTLCSIGRNQIACGSGWTGDIDILDIESDKPVATLTGHTDGVESLLSLPGNQLASGSEDGAVRIWDLKTYKCLKVLKDEEVGIIGSLALNGNNLLVAHSWGVNGYVWDLAKEICLQKFKMGWAMCPLSPEKLLTRSLSENNKIEVWETDDLLNCRQPKEFCQMQGRETSIASINVSSQGKIAVRMDSEGTGALEIWDAQSKKRKNKFSFDWGPLVKDIAWLPGEVCAVLVENTGKGDVFFYDGETGENTGRLPIAVKKGEHPMTLVQVGDSLIVGLSSGELTVMKEVLDVG